MQVGSAQILEILGKITDKLDAHDRIIRGLAQQAANQSVQVSGMVPGQGMPPSMQVAPGTQMVAQPQAPGAMPEWLGPIIQGILPKILGTQTSEIDKVATDAQRMALIRAAVTPPPTFMDRLGDRLVFHFLTRIPGFLTPEDKVNIGKELASMSEAAAHQ